MNYEIVSYGGADFLRYIFNGIAMIFGNDDYLLALGAASLLGLLGWLTNAAFTGPSARSLNPGWFFGMLLLFYGFLVPKVDLIIRDEVNPANTNVVGNIPIGIAATASIFSSFSEMMTETAETVFSLPNGVRYTQTGVLFSTRLMDEINQVTIQDARQSLNWQDFFKNCVYYDLLLGRYTWNDLSRANNLPTFLASNTSESLQFTYTSTAGNQVLSGCKARIGDMVDELDSWMSDNYAPVFMARLNNVDDPDDAARNSQAVARYAAAMPVGITYLTGLSTGASELMQQSALLHSLRRGLSNFASDADASAAAQDFATARAEAERRNTFHVMGDVAKKFVPMASHFFEAIIYAVFPLVLVMAMTPLIAKVVLGYVTVLFWIKLWPPLFAIINFGSTYYTAMESKSRLVYESSSGVTFTSGYNLVTSSGLGSLYSDWAAVTGYMLAFVPMIAYMLVSRSGAMAAGLVGRLMQGYERPASSASDEATKGNIEMGNSRFDTHSAFQTNVSPSMDAGQVSQRDGQGVMHNFTGGGHTAQHNQTSSAVDMSFASQRVSERGSAFQEAQSQTEATRSVQAESASSLLQETQRVASGVQQNLGVGTQHGDEFKAGYDKQVAKLDSSFERYADSVGQGETLRANGGFSFAPKVGGIGGGVAVDKDSMTKEMKELVDGFTRQEDFKDGVKELHDYVRSNTGRMESGIADSYNDGLDSAHNNMVQASREFSMAQQNEVRASEDFREAKTLSDMMKVSSIDTLRQYYNGDFDQLVHTAVHDPVRVEREAAIDQLESLAMMAHGGRGFEQPTNSFDDHTVDSHFQSSLAGVHSASSDNTGIVQGEREQRLGELSRESVTSSYHSVEGAVNAGQGGVHAETRDRQDGVHFDGQVANGAADTLHKDVTGSQRIDSREGIEGGTRAVEQWVEENRAQLEAEGKDPDAIIASMKEKEH